MHCAAKQTVAVSSVLILMVMTRVHSEVHYVSCRQASRSEHATSWRAAGEEKRLSWAHCCSPSHSIHYTSIRTSLISLISSQWGTDNTTCFVGCCYVNDLYNRGSVCCSLYLTASVDWKGHAPPFSTSLLVAGSSHDCWFSALLTRADNGSLWHVTHHSAETQDPVPHHSMSRSRLLTNHDEFSTIALCFKQWCAIWNSGYGFFSEYFLHKL